MFPWPNAGRTLYDTFHRIQDAAGIDLLCRRDHDHGPTCSKYGFHDLRRSMATLNASQVDVFTLRRLMRHKSLSTTQRDVAIADRRTEAAERIYLPEVVTTPRSAAVGDDEPAGLLRVCPETGPVEST